MRIWFGAAAAAATMALACSAAAQQTIKLGYALAKQSHMGIAADAMAELLDKGSNGRFKLEQHAAGSLGGEREMIEGTQLGTIDVVMVSTGPVGNFVPATLVLDIPFLFRDYAHARAVLDGPIGQDILAKFPEKGMVGLAWGELGFRHVTTSKRGIGTPDDMKGLKIRTMENPIHLQAFRSLGALPTPMAWPEVFTALQQGTVDGQETPISAIVAAKFSQVQKHLSLTGHVYTPIVFIMARSTYDPLSAADKKLFHEVFKKGGDVTRAEVEKIEQTGIAQLRAAGMEVTEGIDRAKFQEGMKTAYAEYAKQFGEDTLRRIREFK